jgi:dynein light chain roadblock-type
MTTPLPSKKNVGFQEVQETVSRLAAHKGVTAVLILNKRGDILTQTGKGMVGNPKILKQTLDAAANYIKSIPNEDNEDIPEDGEEDDPTRDISFVRIRSVREEILIAPKNNYVLVVIQDPTLSPL